MTTHAELMAVKAEKQLSAAAIEKAAQEAREEKDRKKKRAADKKLAKSRAAEIYATVKEKIEKNPETRNIEQTYCYNTSDWSVNHNITEYDEFLGDELVKLAKADGYQVKKSCYSGCSCFDKDYPDQCYCDWYVDISW